jgi:hypothetical protein
VNYIRFKEDSELKSKKAPTANVGGINSKNSNLQKQKKFKAAEEISIVRYSPNGSYLAAGCRDNCIHLFDCTKGFMRFGICKGHSSCRIFVSQISSLLIELSH